MWDELSHMSWKSFIGTCIVSVVICTYNFYNFSADFEGELREYIYLLCVGLIILAIGNILLKNRLKKYRGFSYIMQISMFILAIITVQLNPFHFHKNSIPEDVRSVRKRQERI